MQEGETCWLIMVSKGNHGLDSSAVYGRTRACACTLACDSMMASVSIRRLLIFAGILLKYAWHVTQACTSLAQSSQGLVAGSQHCNTATMLFQLIQGTAYLQQPCAANAHLADAACCGSGDRGVCQVFARFLAAVLVLRELRLAGEGAARSLQGCQYLQGSRRW